MSHKFLFNSSFHTGLIAFDSELAEQTRLAGCKCVGTLYQSNYPRSPFGLPFALREYYQERLSFCCGLCRKRITPPSVRFFVRRWFPEPLLILISALKLGATEGRCAQIQRLFGVVISPSTWKRWRRWWCTSFTESHFWLQAKGLIPIEHLNGPFPRELLSIFTGCVEERLVLLLKFLAPLTAGIFRAV
jgi:hypothetical protein